MRVKELNHPNKIVIEWENGGENTQITWSIQATGQGDSMPDDSRIRLHRRPARRSSNGFSNLPGGFNQVIIAAKALIDHGVELNVVADHV